MTQRNHRQANVAMAADSHSQQSAVGPVAVAAAVTLLASSYSAAASYALPAAHEHQAAAAAAVLTDLHPSNKASQR